MSAAGTVGFVATIRSFAFGGGPRGMPKPTCHRPGARAGAGQVACHLSGSLTVLPVRADL